ncbi:MAG: hypothetical protein KJ556_21435 [Gammaproteobacteria bacterium]|nr:hypothetical protein [Gammaproteobacteria bacterium]
MASLDRKNIIDAVKALFIADTGTLYGETKLINSISVKQVEFDKAKIDAKTPYKMFLSTPDREKVETRMQNADYAFTVRYRVEGLTVDPDEAWQKLDDIDERIDYLCDNQMWSGSNLGSYFTNSLSTINDMEFQASTCDVVREPSEKGTTWRVHLEGTIRVEVNRTRT